MGCIRSASAFLIVIFLFHVSVQADTLSQDEEVMTNETIIRMVRSGLNPNVIITKIKRSKTNFDTSDPALIKLGEAKVPNEVIMAMMAAQTHDHPDSNPPPSDLNHKNGGSTVVPDVDEIGFYLLEDNRPMQVFANGFSKQRMGIGEALKMAFTFGIKGAKQKAILRGSAASLRTKNKRPVFLFYAPEGVSPTEYLVIRLERKGDKRETVVGEMGLLRAQAGFQR
jgi:hypothetical protein